MLPHQNIHTETVGSGDLPVHGGGSTSIPSITNNGKHILAPCERLPPELMGSIFRRCFNGGISLPISYDCFMVTMPWVLGQVCSRWRDILTSDPAIWSSLTISYGPVRDRGALTRRIVEIILPRSKLDLISLTCSNIEFSDGGAYHSCVIPALIIPNLARIQHLTLSMAREELEPLITASPGLMTSLESINLGFTWTSKSALNDYCFSNGSITAFEDAPKLRKVYLTGRYFCEFLGADPLTLPWRYLTDINITINLPCSAALKFLPHCVQLVNCWLSIGSLDDRMDELTQSDKITLPRLRSITLCSAYAGTFACSNLVGILTLPALVDFTLHLYDRVSVQETVLELIDRSGCQIERFETTGYFEDSLDDADALLKVMPFLRRFVLPRDYVLPTSTIERMMMGELAPCLEAIHCQVASLPLMMQLLESRRSGESPGAPESYSGIRCSVLWGRGILECQCEKQETSSLFEI